MRLRCPVYKQLAELELWSHCNTDKSSSEICEILEDTVILYPNIHNILKVLLTMPVSTASAERSFSCLRRMKTYLRSTMSETRLTGLALMNIHHDVAINSEKVLRDFDATGTRRIPLLFQD
ncbi:52 kDa repressor of the inhibitor of the protein kinase [Acipenser ruthenus]|uniref:52 kDa repressor of the inhibitor of the protein kinase n=1 Tax=Acipenser ruthenus TaxID=7906 RepID=A0A662YSU5_ACIRT|nr:52 kDa repressor of the inhibitor of the protein kinase [Acipenser ruthenus]